MNLAGQEVLPLRNGEEPVLETEDIQVSIEDLQWLHRQEDLLQQALLEVRHLELVDHETNLLGKLGRT